MTRESHTGRSLVLATSAMLVLLAPVASWKLGWKVPALVALVVAGALAAAATRHGFRIASRPVAVLLAGVPVVATVVGVLLQLSPDGPGSWTISLPAGLAGLAAAAVSLALPARLRWGPVTPVRVFLVGYAALLAADVPRWDNAIDVWYFLTDSAKALIALHNPYTLTFPNIYGGGADFLYGPGVIVDGRVDIGFPYPPFSAVWAVVGQVLGDVRISGLLALAVLAVVTCGRSDSRWTQLLGMLFVLAPGVLWTLGWAWTESSIVGLLGLTVWCLHRRHLTAAAVLLGLLFTSKQYFVVTLPCLWLLRPYASRRTVTAFVAAAAASILPWFAADPAAFWRAVVQWQFIQPFRDDSLSLLVYSVNTYGWPGPQVYGALPLVAGFAVAALYAWRTRPGPAAFAAGIGLVLLTTVLLSKQAFMNYFFLVGGAFLVAAWVSSVTRSRTPTDAATEGDDERPRRLDRSGRSDEATAAVRSADPA